MSKFVNNSSFDRFGDDLTEVVLSYLNFEDRFRFECVSKQWQRLIFTRQLALSIDDFVLNSQSFPDVLELQRLGTILRKCPNISDICVNNWVKNVEQVFHVINRCGRRIYHIESDFDRLSNTTVREFYQKFGSNIRKITFHTNNESNKRVIKFVPNVHSLDIKLFRNLSPLFDGNCCLLFTKLQNISFVYSSEDSERIAILCDTNKSSLRSVEVLTIKELTQQQLDHLFHVFTRIQRLQCLDITCYLLNCEPFVRSLQELAHNCRSLRKLQLVLQTKSLATNLQIFQGLNGFRRLRVLYLNLFGCQAVSAGAADGHMFESKMLNKCQKLTELTFDSYDILIDDRFFLNIHKHWPQLQRIYCTNVDITDQAFHSLSNLPHLLYVYLWSSHTSDTNINESIILTLIEKCLKLKSITYRNSILHIDLEDKDIDALRRHANGIDHKIVIYQ